MKRSAILLALVVLALAACQAAEAPIEEAVDEAPAAEETAAADSSAAEEAEPSPAESGGEDEGSAGTVLLAFGDGYISTIYMVVRRGFEEAGYTVVVASNTLEPIVAHNSPRRVVADILLEDAHMEDYDALVFPSDDSLAFHEPDPEAYRLAREALEQGKVVGAIRAGQFVLARAGLLEGVEMTAHGSYHRRFEEAFGAIWVPAYVHRDGLIVTAAEVPQAALLVEVMLEAMEEQN